MSLATVHTTLGGRAFPVTAARAWNALPSSVRSATSLLQFRRYLDAAVQYVSVDGTDRRTDGHRTVT